MKRIFGIILIISLSLTFLVISIEQSSYNKKYFHRSYEKYNIEKVTNVPMNELLSITDNIILYLKNKGGDELLSPFFNEREILHMRDVQGLFDLARWIKYICIILSTTMLIYFNKKKDYMILGKSMLFGLFINHILFGILAILASIDINRYFTYFHLLFFSNDLWILNPKTDLMIQMLPEEFFMGMAKNIMLLFFIYLAILQVLGYIYIKKGKIIYGRAIKKD